MTIHGRQLYFETAFAMNFEDLFHVDVESAKSMFGEVTFIRLQNAVEDFNAVVEGKRPIHAMVDTDVPLPADGGTTFYKGDGYKLTIVKSLNGIMRGKEYTHGYVYGPIISFEPDVMIGNFANIQYLTFYREEKLHKLLSE
jgi:hypothetical protein